MSDPNQSGGAWTLLTGHGHVLVEIARNPEARIRDISPVVGLTERSVQAIVADLEAAGYLTRARTGRRVIYSVNRDSLFRHSAQDGHRVGPFLDILAATGNYDFTGLTVFGCNLWQAFPDNVRMDIDFSHMTIAVVPAPAGILAFAPLAFGTGRRRRR